MVQREKVTKKSAQCSIAYFISSHGFGHSTRAVAVMEALQRIDPLVRFEIFTKSPECFFHDFLSSGSCYHYMVTDIGLVQKTSLTEDISASIEKLDSFYPLNDRVIKGLAQQLGDAQCQIVLCDIAPMGIAAAQEAGIPSVLIENFTWDWLYEGYLETDERMQKYIDYLGPLFADADYRIQTEPVCQYVHNAIQILPVARQSKISAQKVRQGLRISEHEKIILITMGGAVWEYSFLDALVRHKDFSFIIPGGSDKFEKKGKLIQLPLNFHFTFPDIMNACNGIVGKDGYSTAAEVYYAGIPFMYIIRSLFRESQSLQKYVELHMSSLEITPQQFICGEWLSKLEQLLEMPCLNRPRTENGADQAARFIKALLY